MILINVRLRWIEWLRVLLHEFDQHLLHALEIYFFSDSSVEKTEVEAEVFALVALIPKQMIRVMRSCNSFGEDLLPVELLRRRVKILELYGI